MSGISFEPPMLNSGYVFGIDEAGRGAWAGPLVVCALAAPVGWGPSWAKDSKKFSSHAARKKALDNLLNDTSLFWAVRWISPRRIDEVGIDVAQREEMAAAIDVLFYMMAPIAPGYPERIIIDGSWGDDVFCGAESIVDADDKFAVVSAASIVAKTDHDDYMLQLHNLSKYSGYGFQNHKGYGTDEHVAALERLGISDIHRRSFAPVKKFVDAELVRMSYDESNGPASADAIHALDAHGSKLGGGDGGGAPGRSRKAGRRAGKSKRADIST